MLFMDVMMHNHAAGVSLTDVRGGFDRFFMKPWMACQNTSCYKYRAALVQAENRTRGNFAAVTTCTSYAPCVFTDLENVFSQVERRHSDATPGLGSRFLSRRCR